MIKMKKEDYHELQREIQKLYDTTKYKDYSAKEKEGAKKFMLAWRSKMKRLVEHD